jgi:hypothetical protein
VAGVEDEFPQGKLQIYPNPADTKTKIQFEEFNPGPMVLRVIDQSGRVVFQGDYSSVNDNSEFEINTSELAEGIYILSIQQNERKISGRLLVQH